MFYNYILKSYDNILKLLNQINFINVNFENKLITFNYLLIFINILSTHIDY